MTVDLPLGQLDRLESTITSLLALARDVERVPVESDVDALVSARAGEWARTAATAQRPLNASSTAGTARIDVDAVGHILDVLLDNALRHGSGPITVVTPNTAPRAP